MSLASTRALAAAQLTGLAARAHATLGYRKAARSALAAAERCADGLSVAWDA